MIKNIHNEGQQAKSALQWTNWADNEYIAARQLLLSNTLTQGGVLANTTIEKYLKALLVILNLPVPKGFKGHNICNLYDKVKNKGIKLDISEEYLKLLFKAYRLRYPDDLEEGFNVAINRTKLLVELDHTVYEIRKGFVFNSAGKKIVTKIDQLLRESNPTLLEKNCYFGKYSRSAFFEENCWCYEIRIMKGGTLEVTYMTTGIDDDGGYDLEGLKPGGSNEKNEYKYNMANL